MPRSSAAALAAATKRLRQAVAVGLAEFHEPVLLVAEQMMAERGAEMGQPLVDLGHPRFSRPRRARRRRGGSGYRCAPAAASAPRSGRAWRGCRAACAIRPNSTAFIMIGFQCRAIRKRHFLVDLEQRRVGMRRHQVVEHRRHLGEQLARALQRGDGVGEVGRRRIVGDRGDLGGVVGKGLLEGGQEMLRRDLGERRRLERRLPRPSAAGFRASQQWRSVRARLT